MLISLIPSEWIYGFYLECKQRKGRLLKACKGFFSLPPKAILYVALFNVYFIIMENKHSKE